MRLYENHERLQGTGVINVHCVCIVLCLEVNADHYYYYANRCVVRPPHVGCLGGLSERMSSCHHDGLNDCDYGFCDQDACVFIVVEQFILIKKFKNPVSSTIYNSNSFVDVEIQIILIQLPI